MATTTVTVTTQQYRRDEPVAGAPPPSLPRTGVKAEVKPHNSAGIRAGVEQLKRSRKPGKPLLLTYRTTSDRTPTAFEVLLADPGQLAQALGGGRRAADITRWFRIGGFTAPHALTPIPFAACPPRFGSSVEGSVRSAYARFMRTAHPGFRLGPKHASAGGHDILHEELAAYLRELAEEMETAPGAW